MKKIFKSSLSVLLILAMMLSLSSGLSFGASPDVETQLADKLFLHTNSFYSANAAGDINENYFVYTPNTAVTPYLCHGNDVAVAASMNRVFRLEGEAGNTLIAAVNADYFNTKNGVPIGIEIKDGIIKSSSSYSFPEVGFYSDGRAVIGRSNLSVTLDNVSQSINFSYVNYNKALSDNGGVTVFSRDFNDNNLASGDSLNVLIKITSGSAKAGSSITGTVQKIFEADGAQTLNDGELLMSIYKSSYVEPQNKMNSFNVGDQIKLNFTVDSAWQNVTQAFGAKETLVENGTKSTFSDDTRAPRTAIGTKSDGTLVVYTCDGRNAGGSKGLTLTELARRMTQLGCTNAVNLDGGASTQVFVVYPGNTSQEQINEDSGTYLRSCANYLCFKNNLPATGNPVQLYARENQISVVAGNSKNLSLTARDVNWHAVDINASQIQYNVSDSLLGSASKGVFTAGVTKMSGILTASYKGLSVDYSVDVVTEGQTLADFEDYELANTNLNYVHNGYKSLKLEQDGYYAIDASFSSKHPSMLSYWVYGQTDGIYVEYSNGSDVGTAVGDSNGGWQRYVISLGSNVSEIKGIGYTGEGTVYIDQIVAGFGTYIDDEAPELEISFRDNYINVTVKDTIDEVIDKDDVKLLFDGDPMEFSFNSSSGLAIANLPEADNKVHHVVATARDCSGNIGRASAILDRSFDENQEERTDTFVDMNDTHWASSYVEYLFDQGIITGSFKNDQRYYYPDSNMSRQEFAVIIARWYGVDVSQYEDYELNFVDTNKIGSWALPYVKAVVAMGLINGSSSSGKLYFNPTGTLTRQEAFAIVSRSQEKGYSPDDLSDFSDATSVASWAKDNVSSLVAQGVIDRGSGILNPKKPITRAAVAKVLFELY